MRWTSSTRRGSRWLTRHHLRPVPISSQSPNIPGLGLQVLPAAPSVPLARYPGPTRAPAPEGWRGWNAWGSWIWAGSSGDPSSPGDSWGGFSPQSTRQPYLSQIRSQKLGCFYSFRGKRSGCKVETHQGGGKREKKGVMGPVGGLSKSHPHAIVLA